MQSEIGFLVFVKMQPKLMNKNPQTNQTVSLTQTQKFYFWDFFL